MKRFFFHVLLETFLEKIWAWPENRQEKTFWENEVLIKCKTWFFQKSQNLHFLNASFRARFDRCFIVIVTSETCTLSFLKFDRCFIVVSSFITPRDQSSSLVHRWENFWLFKLLLLMDASAYYVKHRCNTTKHPQDFFLTNKFLLSVFTVFFWKALYWFWEKSVDWFNMFYFYPNSKISFIQNQLAAWG